MRTLFLVCLGVLLLTRPMLLSALLQEDLVRSIVQEVHDHANTMERISL
jgi:hypothetical protein